MNNSEIFQNFKNSKKIIIILLIITFLIGLISVWYIKTQNNNQVQIESFNSEITNDEKYINNTNSPEDNSNSNTTIEDNNQNEIYVHIIGEVNKQGIVKLKEGSRIIDAIEQAGGATSKADLSKVNLAYVLSDGQKVNIPNVNDNIEENGFEYISEGSGNNIIENEITTEKGGKKVNINTATQSQLESLTGIGPSTAEKIIKYREEHGNFKTIDELKNVSGIGETRFNSIKNYIKVK